MTFTTSRGNWRFPDWALVSRERFEAGIEGLFPFPPDVAFEVRSPRDKAPAIERKRRDYSSDGVVQVWVDPDPEKRSVEVVSPKHGSRTFAAGETVVIEELPGFELKFA